LKYFDYFVQTQPVLEEQTSIYSEAEDVPQVQLHPGKVNAFSCHVYPVANALQFLTPSALSFENNLKTFHI
jgi:hypothetical protein